MALLLIATQILLSRALADSELEEDYRRCIQQVAKYVGQLKIDDQVAALVKEARQFYTEIVPIDEDDFDAADRPKSCAQIQKHLDGIPSENECYTELGLGLQVFDTLVDLVASSRVAKDVIEAHYCCIGGKATGMLLQTFGLLEAVQAS